MILQGQKKLVNKIAATRAPSAPAAPQVRNVAGSMAGASSNYATGGATPPPSQITPNDKNPASAQDKPKNPKDVSAGWDTKPKEYQGPPKILTSKRKAPAPVVPTDKEYWANIAALNSQFMTESARTIAEQTNADNDYQRETARLATDRERSRRNLAESLLGRGSSVYSGMHRRDQIEGDIDYVYNADRMGSDKLSADSARAAERADIRLRLTPNSGTEWTAASAAATARADARRADQAESGAPDYSINIKQRVKGENKRIKALRAKYEKVDDPERKKKIRKRIHNIRRRRDAAIRKHNKRVKQNG